VLLLLLLLLLLALTRAVHACQAMPTVVENHTYKITLRLDVPSRSCKVFLWLSRTQQ
jgi:hypothetical protein